MSHSRRSFLGASGVVAAQTLFAVPPSGKQVRIGVGGGNFGTQFPWHLHPNCKVAAVCDVRPDRLDNMMTTFRCDTKYRSFQEMIKHKEMDAVAIFTPVPLHAWMAAEAMRTGKHVIRGDGLLQLNGIVQQPPSQMLRAAKPILLVPALGRFT
jgi:hypothetical protein